MFRQQAGCLGVLFLRAGNQNHSVCSLWRSSSDVDALANSTTYQATAAALAETGVLSGPSSVVLYEVEGGDLDFAKLPPVG